MRPGIRKGAMFLGLALILANGFSTGQFGRMWGVISGTLSAPGSKSTPAGTNIRSDMFVLIGEVIFLAVLTTIADSGDTAESAVLVFMFALWLGWLSQNGKVVANFISAITPKQANVTGVK